MIDAMSALTESQQIVSMGAKHTGQSHRMTKD